MTSPAPALPGNAACPRCGAGFRCGMVAPSGALIDCWCLQQPRALPVPRTRPAALLEVSEVSEVPAPPGLSQPLKAPLPAVLLPEALLPASLTAAFPASLPSAAGPAPDQPAAASCFCPACLEHLTHERQQRLSAAPD